jgi:hypothetical protein
MNDNVLKSDRDLPVERLFFPLEEEAWATGGSIALGAEAGGWAACCCFAMIVTALWNEEELMEIPGTRE